MGDEVARVGIVQVALRAAALEAGEDPAPVVRGGRREVVRHHGVAVLAFLPRAVEEPEAGEVLDVDGEVAEGLPEPPVYGREVHEVGEVQV